MCLPDFYICTPFGLLEQSRILGEDPESKNLSMLGTREKVCVGETVNTDVNNFSLISILSTHSQI